MAVRELKAFSQPVGKLRWGCRIQIAGRVPEIKAVVPPEGAMLNLPKKLHLTRLETRTKESNT